jgi:predicted RNA-binding protein with PUA-like domain
MPKARQCWLVKQEPDTFSWTDFVTAGHARWDGVRNYQARNNIRAMSRGDLVLFYHSVTGKEIVGIARVVREAYPDPTATQGDWSCVDLEPVKPMRQAVPLSIIKETPALADLALVRSARLSVMPLQDEELQVILQLGRTRI